jgi:hypothetical protein
VQILDAAEGKAVGTVVTVRRIHVATVEVQVVGIGTCYGRTPVVGVGSLVVQRGIAVVPVPASGQKKQTLNDVTPNFNDLGDPLKDLFRVSSHCPKWFAEFTSLSRQALFPHRDSHLSITSLAERTFY